MKSLLTKLFGRSYAKARAARTTTARRARLGVEKLDERILPSVSVNLGTNGLLSMTGTAGPTDTMTTISSTGQVQVFDHNLLIGSYPVSSVKEISFAGNWYNSNIFENATPISAMIQGGSQSDTLIGGAGHDTIQGNGGNDTFEFNCNQTSSATINASGTINTLRLDNAPAQVVFDPTTTSPQQLTPEITVTLAHANSISTVTGPADVMNLTFLTDPGLRQSFRAAYQIDQSLSRSDMLQLFTEVEADGQVSSAEFTDLKNILKRSDVNMPDYVRKLSDNVVLGSPANTDYRFLQNGSVTVDSLANLYAGCSEYQLIDLVAKWFYGVDYPDVTNSSYLYLDLKTAPLFSAGGPSYTDVVQGTIGDCYLLGSLAEVAYKNPQAIRNMFIDNGDGTFTVRFFDGGTPEYVTVDRNFPTTWYGATPPQLVPAYANYSEPVQASFPLWVALAEKAYAQINEEGWVGHGNANSYAAIGNGGDSAIALRQIIGNYAGDHNNNGSAFLSGIQISNADGDYVTLGSNAQPQGSNSLTDSNGVVYSHCYALLGVNFIGNGQTYTLYNPWGSIITLTGSQVLQSFSRYSDGAKSSAAGELVVPAAKTTLTDTQGARHSWAGLSENHAALDLYLASLGEGQQHKHSLMDAVGE
jgi:hypothetical protein